MKQNNMRVVFLAVGMSLGVMATTVAGSTITLQNNNSTVTINPGSSAGVEDWTVNGVNQLAQQWFWYAIDGGTCASIDTLSNSTSSSYLGSRGVSLTYSNSTQGLSVEVDYLLTGGGASGGNSDLSETISITNTSAAPQLIPFSQYSNFTLEGSATGDSVSFPNTNTVTQSKADLSLTETVVTPAPAAFEGDYSSANLLAKIIAGTTLSNQPASGQSMGPGHMNWACQWDPTIQPGGTFIISEDDRLVAPEPGTLALLGSALLGLAGVVYLRRRRSKA